MNESFVTQNEIYDELVLASKSPNLANRIRQYIKKGDVIRKGSDMNYLIDSVDITPVVGKLEKKQIPYRLIQEYFSLPRDPISLIKELDNLFEGNEQIPYSKAVEKHKGNCTEQAIAFQLTAQAQNVPSFYISGWFNEDTDDSKHAFNVAFKKGIPYLVDTTNPLINTEQEYVQFIIPLKGMDSEGKFILPKMVKTKRGTYSLNRTYSLF